MPCGDWLPARGAMSGRMMAAALGVSPTTATAALGKLRDAGFATASREGRADRWRINTDNALVRSWLEETRDEPKAPEATGGASPYSTGGGSVTFERKVAVQYLAHLLIGDGAAEFGDARRVVAVAFQQAPEHSVDDLVIYAARADDLEPSLVLAVGVRRLPDLVQSDESTRKLIRAFVSEIINAARTARSAVAPSWSPARKSMLSNWPCSPALPPGRWARSCARRANSTAASAGASSRSRASSSWHLQIWASRTLESSWSSNTLGKCCPGSPC